MVLLSLLIPSLALADPYIYPAKGQTKEQQEKDQYQCYEWSKQQSGFDPTKEPKATSPPPTEQAPEGGVMHGAVRGAAIGAIGGAIGGDAGKGAAIGAMAGGMFGGMRRRHQANEQAAEQQQWEDQQVANYQRNRGNYDRAYAACLTGRGYTVN